MARTDLPPFEPSTYFGTWSGSKYAAVSELLASLGVRYWSHAASYTEEALVEWEAWDPTSPDPLTGIDLWIHSEDLGLVGNAIVDRFPERRFVAKPA
jgi:hypothetical protein